ncbi:MAG: DUF1489 domain-containing protein [Pseudomonadota bacterium]
MDKATLHLIKLAVGAESIASMAAWQAHVQSRSPKRKGTRLFHDTRMVPKRAGDILPTGSIFWVIKGVVSVRQRIVDIEAYEAGDGRRCRLWLDPSLIETRPQPRRPFQGWRYLRPEDAPADLGAGSQTGEGDLPADMRAELMELGLL